MGPVINQKQFDKIKNYIEIGKEEGKLEQGGGTDDSKGYFIEPTIFSGLKSADRIMQEEIFGPVLAVATYKDDDEAIEIANDTFRERIGGFPKSAQEFLDEQKAYAQFSRADHQNQEWPPQRFCYYYRRSKRLVHFLEPALGQKRRRL